MTKNRLLSGLTIAFFIAGLAAIAVTYALILIFNGSGNEFGSIAASDIGELLIVVASAASAVWVALGFEKGEPLRRRWLLIGAGIALFAAGDAVWTYIEVFQQAEVPFPGLPDVFYLTQYVFLGVGMVLAALAFRRLMDVKAPLALSVLVTAVPGALLYFFLLKDMLADTESDAFTKVVGIFYPIGDLLLVLLPAVFIVFVASKLRGGKLQAPWWPVAAGAVILAVTDSVYLWLDWQGSYRSGMLVDIGWMLGYLLIATGALTARDVERVPAS